MTAKFIISKYLFSLALGEAKKAMLKKSLIPILENFLLTVEDGYITVTATDFSRWVSAKTKCETNAVTKLQAVVPAKVLTFLSRVDDMPLSCSWDNETNVFSLTTDVDTVQFQGEDAGQFPTPPKFKDSGDELTTLPAEALNEMYNLIPFMSENEDRQYRLCGVRFEGTPKGDGFYLCASNGALIRYTLFGKNTFKYAFTLKHDTARLLASYRPAKKTKMNLVTVEVENKSARFTFEDGTGHLQMTVIGLTLNEPFPDWQMVMPIKFTTVFEGITGDFTKLLAKAETIMSTDYKVIVFRTKENGIVLMETYDGHNGHKYEGAAYVQAEGPEIEIGFHAPYLKLLLNSFAGQNFTFQFNNPLDIAVARQGSSIVGICPVNLNEYIGQ